MSTLHGFGKLPASGDFLHLNLNAAGREGVHQWLSQGLSSCVQQHSPTWWDHYFHMPMLAFISHSGMNGLLGPAPVAGVWMPSVDTVGRPFPFMAWAELHTNGPCATVVLQLAHVLTQALDENWPADRVEAAWLVHATPTAPDDTTTPGPHADGWWSVHSGPDGLALNWFNHVADTTPLSTVLDTLAPPPQAHSHVG